MSRASKGDRVVTTARLARPVWELVTERAAAAGVSVSAYVSDVMAEHVGRGDLVAELGRRPIAEGLLPLAM